MTSIEQVHNPPQIPFDTWKAYNMAKENNLIVEDFDPKDVFMTNGLFTVQNVKDLLESLESMGDTDYEDYFADR